MATRVEVLLQADLKSITLQVADNGRGLGDSTPKSLKRRARLLRGRMAVRQGASSGSTITLTLRRPRATIFSRILQARKPTP